MKRFAPVALAASAAAILAASASAGPTVAWAQSAQGGIANPGSTNLAPAQINSRRHRIDREVRRLRSEVRASLKRNNGSIPEPERSTLQARLDALRVEAARN